MSEEKSIRISKALKDFNVAIDHVKEVLDKIGVEVDKGPNTKISEEAYRALENAFASDKQAKAVADSQARDKHKRENITIDINTAKNTKPNEKEIDDVGEIDLKKALDEIKAHGSKAAAPAAKPPVVEKIETPPPVIISEKAVEPEKNEKAEENAEPEVIKAKAKKNDGPVVLGTIDLEGLKKPKKKTTKAKEGKEDSDEVVEPQKKKSGVSENEKTLEEITDEKPVTEAPKSTEQTSETETETPTPEAPETDNVIRASAPKLADIKVLGTITLPTESRGKRGPAYSTSANSADNKKKRKRKDKKPVTSSTDSTFKGDAQGRNRPPASSGGPGTNTGTNTGSRPPYGARPPQTGARPPQTGNRPPAGAPFKPGQKRPLPAQQKTEFTTKEIQDQMKAVQEKIAGQKGKSKSAGRRRDKRQAFQEARSLEDQDSIRKIKVTEFVSANDLAKLMDVPVTQIISACMSLGYNVSINQRLDAEMISVVAAEFEFEVEFVSADVQEAISEQVDTPEDLLPRAPIVTVMGHVDHGKTSLLDFVRNTNVLSGEAGGITQHIGAYEVTLESGKKICFLDTPGHEAFTAMRARGAKVTDVAIIVIAADDSVMPQTIEAINHAAAAGVPIVFALNKMDKSDANPERIREQLAKMNYLVEDWGGKYQCQEISAKKGLNIDKLLEKVLLEAEMLELKANPNRNAKGTVIEATLDKGRGFVVTMLVQTGTLNVGDVVLAGCYTGKVKAMFDERNNRLKSSGPSTPVMILGLSGAAQAGDQFNVMDDEREARNIANRRLQLQREQGIRSQKHITLDEIGRRLAIGTFKELNLIVKGDVDGSVEALSDSLLKLSTTEIQVNVIHKSVGQISESDVLLASASNAIILGFQVRPSSTARKLAEVEEIDIRLYSVIYDAINEVKAAMEGMLAPDYEEKIICNIEIRDVFKIPKVGTIAGCMVLDGKITRNTRIRIIRDGIVVHTGELASLKRFKDDVKEVATGYECGLNIANFNDIQIGDIVEGYESVAVKRTLA
nr:translation initiation factor IF-2 [Bacteroidota bacterium]